MKKLINWSEKDLFEYLKENFYSDLTPMDSQYSFEDCITTEHSITMELKCRTLHRDLTGMMIEKQKYDNLLKHREINKSEHLYYVNSTPAGVYYWDVLKTPEPKWEKEYCNERTNLPTDGVLKKIDKMVGYYPVKDAVCLGTSKEIIDNFLKNGNGKY